MNVAFLGSRPLSLKALELLLAKSRHRDIKLAVFSKSDDSPPPGVIPWWNLRSLRKLSRSKGLHLIESERQLLGAKYDLVVMVFFNDIIPKTFISKNPFITNVHFGYLPTLDYSKKRGSPHGLSQPFSINTYRGCNVLSHAILNGEKWQAVTFHFITEKIDLGPVISYEWNRIEKNTTAWDLQLLSEKKALGMLSKYYPVLLNKPGGIGTKAPGRAHYPYYQRNSLEKLKHLNPKTTHGQLDRIARALCFPNTEPAYFLEGRLKRYVIYRKNKGLDILKAQKETFIQDLAGMGY